MIFAKKGLCELLTLLHEFDVEVYSLMVIELRIVIKYQISLYDGVSKLGRISTSYGKTFTNSWLTLFNPHLIYTRFWVAFLLILKKWNSSVDDFSLSSRGFNKQPSHFP